MSVMDSKPILGQPVFTAGEVVRRLDGTMAPGTVLGMTDDGRVFLVGQRTTDTTPRFLAMPAVELERTTDDNPPGIEAVGAAIVAKQEALVRNREMVRTAQEAQARAEQTLAAYKIQVREVAIRVAEEQDWCNEGLNEVLTELGLDGVTRSYRVPVELTATQTVYIDVEAIDIDHAVSQVEDNYTSSDLAQEADGDDWSVSDYSVDTYSVEEA
jgi:hypothetical protein